MRDAELNQQNAERDCEKREAASSLGAVEGQLRMRDADVAALEEKAAFDARRSRDRNQRIAGSAWRLSVSITTIPRWVAVLVLTYVAFRPWLWSSGSSTGSPFVVAGSAAALFAAATSLWSLLTGGYVRGVFHQWQIAMATWMLDEWWHLRPPEVTEAMAAHLASISQTD